MPLFIHTITTGKKYDEGRTSWMDDDGEGYRNLLRASAIKREIDRPRGTGVSMSSEDLKKAYDDFALYAGTPVFPKKMDAGSYKVGEIVEIHDAMSAAIGWGDRYINNEIVSLVYKVAGDVRQDLPKVAQGLADLDSYLRAFHSGADLTQPIDTVLQATDEEMARGILNTAYGIGTALWTTIYDAFRQPDLKSSTLSHINDVDFLAGALVRYARSDEPLDRIAAFEYVLQERPVLSYSPELVLKNNIGLAHMAAVYGIGAGLMPLREAYSIFGIENDIYDQAAVVARKNTDPLSQSRI